MATLIREAVPGIADTDLRRAREYLNASGMVVNQRGGGQPLWFIRADWHQGPGGHVHVVTTSRAGQQAIPLAAPPPGDAETGEPAGRPASDIAEALQLLVQQVSELQADNERLRKHGLSCQLLGVFHQVDVCVHSDSRDPVSQPLLSWLHIGSATVDQRLRSRRGHTGIVRF